MSELSHLTESDLADLEKILDHVGTGREVVMYLKGAGFTSSAIKGVKKWLSPCLCYSSGTKKTLKKYGSGIITNLQIYRTPLSSLIGMALQGLTLGKWYKLMSQFGFDKFYHLALVATISGGKNIIIQKNEVIDVSTSYKTNSNTDTYTVPFISSDNLTIAGMLNHTKNVIGEDKFFLYDAFNNNCQYFVRNILRSNGLLTEEADEFLFQDIGELGKEIPSYVKKSARGLTDIAATASKLLGRGHQL